MQLVGETIIRCFYLTNYCLLCLVRLSKFTFVFTNQ